MNHAFPKYRRRHEGAVLQYALVIAADEVGHADAHFDMSPDFPYSDDDIDDYYDRYYYYYLCGDEMRDYLHLNTDRPNSGDDVVVADNSEIVAAAESDAAAAVLFLHLYIYDHRQYRIAEKKQDGLPDLYYVAILFSCGFLADPSLSSLSIKGNLTK